jgi:hypothetical protein
MRMSQFDLSRVSPPRATQKRYGALRFFAQDPVRFFFLSHQATRKTPRGDGDVCRARPESGGGGFAPPPPDGV